MAVKPKAEGELVAAAKAEAKDKVQISLPNGRKLTVEDYAVVIKNLDDKSAEFRDAAGRSDEALYEALKLVYVEYLLASKVFEHKEKLNKLITERLALDNDFSIDDQPESNLFGALIRATVLYNRPGSNEKYGETLKKAYTQANQYSMALHWCLRNSMMPNEVLEAFNEHGMTGLRVMEQEARTGGRGEVIQTEQQIRVEATRILSEQYGQGPKIEVDMGMAESDGIGMFLTKIVTVGGKREIQLLRQVSMPEKTIEKISAEFAKDVVLDNSSAGVVPRLATIGKQYFGDPTKCELVISSSSGWVHLINKSTKAVLGVAAMSCGFEIDTIPEDKVCYIRETDLNALVIFIEGNPLANNWRIDAVQDEAALKAGVERNNFILRCNVGETQKEFPLSIRNDEDVETPAVNNESGDFPTVEIHSRDWASIEGLVKQVSEKKGKSDDDYSNIDMRAVMFDGIDKPELVISILGVSGSEEHLENKEFIAQFPEIGLAISKTAVPKLTTSYEEASSKMATWTIGEKHINVEFGYGPTAITVTIRNELQPKRPRKKKD